MPAPRPTVSVVMITKDAAQVLRPTLAAISWADEVVIVDSGSSDETRELATELGARVVSQTEWKGYGYQKNFAIAQVNADWIFVLDADEVVDHELAAAIQRVVADPDAADGYSMRRVNFFCGERLRFGAGRPSYVDRLFRRGKGRVSDHRVHESVVIGGRVERLSGELLHYTTESISHRIRKNDAYATTAAQELHRAGRRVSLLQLVTITPLSVWRDLLLKGGILDGKKGVIMAFTGAFYSFSKLAKLWELQKKARNA